jgi:hypothetical protein
MRYFHRTGLSPDGALAEADAHFGARLATSRSSERSRTFQGTIGTVHLAVQAEGGHYTLITVETDQAGESEADKLSKRFLTLVHQRHQPRYVVRGAY